MKWGNRKGDLRIHSWKDVEALVITILVICVIIGMAFDFVNWKMAMGAIKKSLPSNAQVILDDGGSPHYTPFRWAGELKGRIYLMSDRDLNIQTRKIKWTDGKIYEMDGAVDGSIKSISGVDLPLKLINNDPSFPISYGKTTLKNANGSHTFEIWVYLISKGQPVYKKIYIGQKAVDYPITKDLIRRYRSYIDDENTMTDTDIEWLCSFTHDSLHQYILSFFEQNKVPELFKGRNIYAYRLDSKIAGINKWVKVYKTELTNERKNACVGIIYKVDGRTYVRVVYNGWWIGCKGGGYVFDFYH